MDQNQHMADDLTSPVTVHGKILEDSANYEWGPLTATISWESEPPFLHGTGVPNEPFTHLFLSPPPERDTHPRRQFGSALCSQAPTVDGPFSPEDVISFSWHHYSSVVTNAADLMRIYDKQAAAKREKRKVQNRKAQHAYRERRKQQVEILRGRIAEAEKQCKSQAHQIQSLQDDLDKLRNEREALLEELRRPPLPTSNPSGSSTDTVGPVEDDLLS